MSDILKNMQKFTMDFYAGEKPSLELRNKLAEDIKKLSDEEKIRLDREYLNWFEAEFYPANKDAVDMVRKYIKIK